MKIVILGGGISGLSAAWFLAKKYERAQITLIEKESRLGGLVQTSYEGGFLFEKGPRTFQTSRCPNLLELIRELGLEGELIFSDRCASSRYLWSKGRLRSVASFLPQILPALLCEPFRAKGTSDDESIYEFASRRFGPKIAATLFDALTLGIYAGDIRKLSIRTCFPPFFQMEREKGSVVLGLFFSKKKQGPKGLFTLQSGMNRLIERLAEKSAMKTILNTTVEAIRSDGVIANGIFYPADRIISALPGSTIGRLTGLWDDFLQTDLWVVSLAYAGDVLSKKGFGYLVPTQEKENLLGMVWDSSIFPKQNTQGETRVTAMMREGSVEAARDAMKRHLGVFQSPLFTSAFLAKRAIPQFQVGYWERLDRFEQEAKAKFPSLVLLGNYIKGASVDACIALAKNLESV